MGMFGAVNAAKPGFASKERIDESQQQRDNTEIRQLDAEQVAGLKSIHKMPEFSKKYVEGMQGLAIGKAWKNQWKDAKAKNGWNMRQWQVKYDPAYPAASLCLAYIKEDGRSGNGLKKFMRVSRLPRMHIHQEHTDPENPNKEMMKSK